jgi:hypothetical protein
MTRQNAVIKCLLAVEPNESRDNAEAYAARVWKKYFSHVDFMMWNGEISEETVSQLVSEAKNRAPLREEDVASLMEFLGADPRRESSGKA